MTQNDIEEDMLAFYLRIPPTPFKEQKPVVPVVETQTVGEFRSRQGAPVPEEDPRRRRPAHGVDAPPTPANFRETHAAYNVLLEWDAVAPRYTGETIRYNIYWRVGSSGGFGLIAQGLDALAFNHTGLSQNTLYQYQITAVGYGEQESARSPVLVVTTANPPATGIPPGSEFDVAGPVDVSAVLTYAYTFTIRSNPTFSGLVAIGVADAFITVYNAGGIVVSAGIPIVLSTTNPIAAVAGVASFGFAINPPAGAIPPGGFCVGYVDYIVRDVLNPALEFNLYGSPYSTLPNRYRVIIH